MMENNKSIEELNQSNQCVDKKVHVNIITIVSKSL